MLEKLPESSVRTIAKKIWALSGSTLLSDVNVHVKGFATPQLVLVCCVISCTFAAELTICCII